MYFSIYFHVFFIWVIIYIIFFIIGRAVIIRKHINRFIIGDGSVLYLVILSYKIVTVYMNFGYVRSYTVGGFNGNSLIWIYYLNIRISKIIYISVYISFLAKFLMPYLDAIFVCIPYSATNRCVPRLIIEWLE